MALKSAWELALERTGGKSAGKLVTAAQKAKLAEVEARLQSEDCRSRLD